MGKNKIRKKWTQENINYLKAAYLQGSPLKKIAAQLNRSVSSVNKTLARHNLRTHTRMERIPSLAAPAQKQKPAAKNKKKNTYEAKRFCGKSQQWVIFDRVVSWLRSQKVSVIKSNLDVYYEINGFPKSKHQILFMANVLREQHQLPIFFVKGVTNS